VDHTINNENGYPEYQRRNNEHENHIRNGRPIHNGWVVPYNRYLSKKYNAHINVEICSSVSAIKYIIKYMHKGYDKSLLEIETERDEVTMYLETRTLTSHEALWRLFQYTMIKMSPTIQRLDVHLENQQMVTFNGDQTSIDSIATRAETTLTAWFRYNQAHDDGRHILYINFPKHFRYVRNNWQRRINNVDAIGRMYNVSLNDKERFYLRLLLTHVSG